MSEPTEDQDDEQPVPKRVRVPIRRGDSVFSSGEYAEVELEAAGQWDATQWRDRPLL